MLIIDFYSTVYELIVSVFIDNILTTVYKALRNLPDYVHSQWDLYGAWGPGAVQDHTAGIRKCCLHQSAFCGPVNWHVRLWNCTPSVQGAMGWSCVMYRPDHTEQTTRVKNQTNETRPCTCSYSKLLAECYYDMYVARDYIKSLHLMHFDVGKMCGRSNYS